MELNPSSATNKILTLLNFNFYNYKIKIRVSRLFVMLISNKLIYLKCSAKFLFDIYVKYLIACTNGVG